MKTNKIIILSALTLLMSSLANADWGLKVASFHPIEFSMDSKDGAMWESIPAGTGYSTAKPHKFVRSSAGGFRRIYWRKGNTIYSTRYPYGIPQSINIKENNNYDFCAGASWEYNDKDKTPYTITTNYDGKKSPTQVFNEYKADPNSTYKNEVAKEKAEQKVESDKFWKVVGAVAITGAALAGAAAGVNRR